MIKKNTIMESEEMNNTLSGQMKKLDDALYQLCIDLTPKFIRKWIDKIDNRKKNDDCKKKW